MKLINRKKFKRIILGQLANTYRVEQVCGHVNLVPTDPTTRLPVVQLYVSEDAEAAKRAAEKYKQWQEETEQEG